MHSLPPYKLGHWPDTAKPTAIGVDFLAGLHHDDYNAVCVSRLVFHHKSVASIWFALPAHMQQCVSPEQQSICPFGCLSICDHYTAQFVSS